MAEGAGDKTEKATPKKREDALKKGQVARSMDLNGAIVLMASLMVLSATAPKIMFNLKHVMATTLSTIKTPEVVSKDGLGSLITANATVLVQTVAPIALVCLVAGLVTNLAQVRWHPSTHSIKPNLKKLDPLKGAKNIFGPQAAFETGKTLAKLVTVGTIAAMALFPQLGELAALVGMPPAAMLPHVGGLVLGIAQRAGATYLVIAAVDYAWQKYRHEKQLKMSKEEVKEEAKSQSQPQEVRSAVRRRQMEEARKRMLDDVPLADVVVTNPTHYAVALKYDGDKPAPQVVAKGKDLIAFKIRSVAEEHGVPVIEDKPLARGLHGSVEVGHMIPEEFFQAVAQLLAFVYRVAGRKVV
ncbi:MAG: flagellar biosynthesis protein FlhB [Thermoleophilaceae bacterium]|nr:flagellar biosynthesis protein FlhB [Thermoleophilaceae bacterium]